MAVSLGADADTLGAIVGSIAEAIWGIPNNIRDTVEEYLPMGMLDVLSEFHMMRPRSFKPLMDTTFAGKSYSSADWDALYDLEGAAEANRIKETVDSEKDEKRRLMAERGKARLNW